MRLSRIPAPTRKRPCRCSAPCAAPFSSRQETRRSPCRRARPFAPQSGRPRRARHPLLVSSDVRTLSGADENDKKHQSLHTRALQVVLLDLGQESLVTDAEFFGGARLVAVVRAQGVGYLAPP